MHANCKFSDKNLTRYQLLKTMGGTHVPHWIFFPGGPGTDSSYFTSLISLLNMPGNYWLIDLPENGSNVTEGKGDYDFDHWQFCFLSAIKNFNKPILVGHSFGGMYPLLFPELEDLLGGFVILNSVPSLWLEECQKLALKHNIPLLTEPLSAYERNPCQETFKAAILACAPYYFTDENLEKGKQLLEKLTFNYKAAAWWLKKVNQELFNAKWVPQNVLTLIIGATRDFICPVSLFERDMRFKRHNIQLNIIKDAGHLPWMDKMDEVKAIFSSYANQLNVSEPQKVKA